MTLSPPAWGALVTKVQTRCEISLKMGLKDKTKHELCRKNDMLDSETIVKLPR
jgi:hypothetical protein